MADTPKCERCDREESEHSPFDSMCHGFRSIFHREAPTPEPAPDVWMVEGDTLKAVDGDGVRRPIADLTPRDAASLRAALTRPAEPGPSEITITFYDEVSQEEREALFAWLSEQGPIEKCAAGLAMHPAEPPPTGPNDVTVTQALRPNGPGCEDCGWTGEVGLQHPTKQPGVWIMSVPCPSCGPTEGES